jgi:hypothetical protein
MAPTIETETVVVNMAFNMFFLSLKPPVLTAQKRYKISWICQLIIYKLLRYFKGVDSKKLLVSMEKGLGPSPAKNLSPQIRFFYLLIIS